MKLGKTDMWKHVITPNNITSLVISIIDNMSTSNSYCCNCILIMVKKVIIIINNMSNSYCCNCILIMVGKTSLILSITSVIAIVVIVS